jgi:hypothetical protein
MSDVYISPELIASLAVLLTALTGLVLALRGQAAQTVTQKAVVDTQAQVTAHGDTIDKVLTQTNGAAAAASDRMTALETIVAQLAIAQPAVAPVASAAPVTPSPQAPAPVPRVIVR